MRWGTPEKCGVIGYYCIFSIYQLYVMQNPRMITMATRWVTMETPAHARAVCTRPFLLLLLKGLGTRLGLVLQVAQWYYSSGVPSFYLLVYSITAYTIPYSLKYWRELNLAVEPKITITRILADLNLAVRYVIAIRIYASRKFWRILIWRL